MRTKDIKGYIGTRNGFVYYTDGKCVYKAKENALPAVDVATGYLQGRWECDVSHWNRYCDNVYDLPKIEEVK